MAENNFKSTVESLFKGMDGFLSSKTIVGEPIEFGKTIIVPLCDVTFGVAAGAFGDGHKNNAGGGMGGKMSPSSVLVIQGDKIKLVNIKNQDGLTKVLDLVPDIVDKISGLVGKDQDQEADPKKEEAKEQLSQMIYDAVDETEEE